jgi:predicted RNase H-like HicB family nuclease
MIPKLIKTETEHEAALARVETLMDAKSGSAQESELEVWSVLIEKFEEERFPIDLRNRAEHAVKRIAARPESIIEIIFEVREDEADGGYVATALGHSIVTQGDTLDELRANVKEAVDCHFDQTMQAPKIIRLHFVRDEVL